MRADQKKQHYHQLLSIYFHKMLIWIGVERKCSYINLMMTIIRYVPNRKRLSEFAGIHMTLFSTGRYERSLIRLVVCVAVSLINSQNSSACLIFLFLLICFIRSSSVWKTTIRCLLGKRLVYHHPKAQDSTRVLWSESGS